MAQPFERDLDTTVHSMKNKAHEQVEKAASQVESAAETLSRKSREISSDVQTVTGNITTAVDKSLKEQPYTTLAMAAAMAFVLGAIWKS